MSGLNQSQQNLQEQEDEARSKLIECQIQTVGKESCWDCEELIKCETRHKFLNAVYKTMNPNSDGGFTF